MRCCKEAVLTDTLVFQFSWKKKEDNQLNYESSNTNIYKQPISIVTEIFWRTEIYKMNTEETKTLSPKEEKATF